MAGYGNRISAVLKENGGQASAFNAGFAVSRGDVVIFLDSDDVLMPPVVAEVMPLFREPAVAKVHWPLWEIDPHGTRIGEVTPRDDLSEGDLRDEVLRAGADGYAWPPTSGNAWARGFLERVLPMPEAEYRTCPDFFLSALAPLYGRVGKLSDPQGCWRVHGGNHSRSAPIEKRLEELRWRSEHCLGELSKHCRALSLPLDIGACMANSWWQWLHRIHLATRDIERLVPGGDAFILANEDTWDDREEVVVGRRPIPFLEKEGRYWGPPSDDLTAVAELERLRQSGATFAVFAWPAFWWLDYYADFHRHLRANFRCVLENDRLVVFDLRPG
jgi:glycosyltransferase involved in cell wall biosynthesis